MEANENMIPQTGRVEDEYVRIGTTLFRILNQPMMNGSFRKIRVEWKMSTFRQDHSKDEVAQIPKYVIVKTCSDNICAIGQKKCPMFAAKIHHYSHSHNLMGQ